MPASAEKLLAADGPLIIGHRGCCAIAPENTLPSFQLALDAGAELVELDYQHSKDGVPMVIHDAILDRTTNARKKWKARRIKVSKRTAAEIQTLDAGSWFDAKFNGAKVPLLTEALDFICGHGGVAVIERKSGDAETLAKLLRERELVNKVIVIAFDWKFLCEFHQLEPKQILGALGPPARLSNGRRPVHVRRALGARLKDLEKTGAKIAAWNRKVSKRSIQGASKRGLRVWVYTVDESRMARRLIKSGVSAIITNDLRLKNAPGIASIPK
ncbi:MAG TPA: glycerophosphodiester phosphodiesterase family protein [Verrucomicrobiae bacterium]|nr:glycerophosphodiester phosphodiesterase family protein [Verrucomicrobiae bacterium]